MQAELKNPSLKIYERYTVKRYLKFGKIAPTIFNL